MKRAGYTIPKHAYRALSWLNFGVKSLKPIYGSIAVKERRGGGHVCFVVGGSEDGKYLDCLGGNQDNEVKVTRYRADIFKDFRIPKGYHDSRELTSWFEAQKIEKAGSES